MGAWNRGASCSWRREVLPGVQFRDRWGWVGSLGMEAGEARGARGRSGVERQGGGRLRVGRVSRRVWKPKCEMLPKEESSRSL